MTEITAQKGLSVSMVQEQGVSFGTLLQRLRKSAGFTQEELASRAGLTAKAISALERGERKHPYPHTVRSLADALNLSEEERSSLLATVPKKGRTVASPDASDNDLPAPMTPLLGRERELRETRDFLKEARLLTLTGTGGVGKTRLALEVAREARGLFPDGVAFVGLASLRDPSLVISSIVESLAPAEGRDPREALLSHLRGKRFLLVLDNFEHVLEAALDVAAVIEACPDLVVLATSRAPLRFRFEQEYPVQPLALPASTRSPRVEEVADSPAGRLFTERAKVASLDFEVTEKNAAPVAAICWRLSGLPLALELAAARVRLMDPQTLLSRLDRALSTGWARDLPERQRTMRTTLDWSYELLSGSQQALFRRLSVFAGGFTLEAAEGVGEAEEVMDLLAELIEQSLVTVKRDAGEARYGMLEPVRQYSLEKLEENGEAVVAKDRHAGHYLALAGRIGPKLRGPEQATALSRLKADLDNLRAALGWSIENGGVEKVAEAAWVSWTFWWSSGHLGEGRRWMEEALAAEADLSASVRAKLLFVAATLGQAIGDFESTWAMLEESRALFEQVGDKAGIADSLGSGGLVALGRGRHEEGYNLMEKAIELDLEVGNRWGAAAMLGFSATVPLAKGDLERARRQAERGLSLAREVGARDVIYVALHPLATIALMEGNLDRAKHLFEEGLTLSVEVGEKANVAFCLEGLAAIAATTAGESERAARLWGSAEALLEEIEVISYPYASDRSLRQSRLAEARERLDEKTWLRACAEGREMTFDQAIEYALDRDREEDGRS